MSDDGNNRNAENSNNAEHDAERAAEQNSTPAPANNAATTPGDGNAPEQFDRGYVDKLRGESASYRKRAKSATERAEQYAKRLAAARVAALGELQDPAALPITPEVADMEDDALAEYVAEYLAENPGARRVAAPGGLPVHTPAGQAPSLVSLLRAGA